MSNERFPPIPPSEMNNEQKEIHEEMISGASKAFGDKGFKFQRKDGAMVGPFAPLMYTPKAVAHHFFNLAVALGSIPGFSPAAREVAILATGAQFNSKYEMYAHENISVATGVLSRGQIERLMAGQAPGSEDGKGEASNELQTAYEVSIALINERGPLRRDLWEKAVSTYGREGAAGLIHYVGAYCYTCCILNGFDVPVPAEDS